MSLGRARCRSHPSTSKSLKNTERHPPLKKSRGRLAPLEVERLEVQQRGEASDVTRHLPKGNAHREREREAHTMQIAKSQVHAQSKPSTQKNNSQRRFSDTHVLVNTPWPQNPPPLRH
eukprot:711852-Amphidinium_carterae.1